MKLKLPLLIFLAAIATYLSISYITLVSLSPFESDAISDLKLIRPREAREHWTGEVTDADGLRASLAKGGYSVEESARSDGSRLVSGIKFRYFFPFIRTDLVILEVRTGKVRVSHSTLPNVVF